MNRGFLHYTDMEKFLKNLLLWNRWSDFEIISLKCSLGNPFQKLLAKFWSVNKHSSGKWGLLALYGHKESLKSPEKNGYGPLKNSGERFFALQFKKKHEKKHPMSITNVWNSLVLEANLWQTILPIVRFI